MRVFSIALGLALLSGCASKDGADLDMDADPQRPDASTSRTDGGTPNGGVDPFAADRQRCVDRINQYRAMIGRPAYARWTERETCTDQAARTDSLSGAHASFGSCGEFAQNECPAYKSAADVTGPCLQAMWAEGPGGGHYNNMASTRYTKVACGFYRTPDGKVWGTQNFR